MLRWHSPTDLTNVIGRNGPTENVPCKYEKIAPCCRRSRLIDTGEEDRCRLWVIGRVKGLLPTFLYICDVD